MAATRANAASKIDWSRLPSALGLRGSTLSALNNFKSRNDDARRKLQALESQPTDVDFSHYRSVLKNTSVIDEIEKAMKNFQVKKVDLARQLKAIEGFEATAVKSATETAGAVETELGSLRKTLENIEGARPFEDLTVDEVMAAEPEIEKRVERMVANHRWMPAGYKEKFGDLALI